MSEQKPEYVVFAATEDDGAAKRLTQLAAEGYEYVGQSTGVIPDDTLPYWTTWTLRLRPEVRENLTRSELAEGLALRLATIEKRLAAMEDCFETWGAWRSETNEVGSTCERRLDVLEKALRERAPVLRLEVLEKRVSNAEALISTVPGIRKVEILESWAAHDCPKCGGTGRMRVPGDPYNHKSTAPCNACLGTGRVKA